MTSKTLIQMTDEVREVNTAKGWREPGKTFGDYIALLHTEVGEMTDAFRRWGLEDATGDDGKPEGVASELADVLIRAIDTADVISARIYGHVNDYEASLNGIGVLDLSARGRRGPVTSGPLISLGDYASLLHRLIDRMWDDAESAYELALGINLVARRYGIDLMAEYERKMKFNWTRDYRHGGKLL